MSFREVREYAAGDDIRFIDWNVSARFNHPFSKLFEEERELDDDVARGCEREFPVRNCSCQEKRSDHGNMRGAGFFCHQQ